jgi:transcriptional regulator with XRE-family HTH domain
MLRNQRQFSRTFIRDWRQYRGLTLEQLAGRLNMTSSHLSMLERGQRGYTQETLEHLAEALQTSVASLLTRRPGEDEIWNVWDRASVNVRRQLLEIAKTLTKNAPE